MTNINHVRPNGMLPSQAAWEPDDATQATLKNQWDKSIFPGFPSSTLYFGMTDEPDIDLMMRNNPGGDAHYGTVSYSDGTNIVEHRFMWQDHRFYILPDPPLKCFNPSAHYKTKNGCRIPCKVWQVSFYVLKPFVVEELCNEVQSGCVNHNAMLKEFTLIFWAVHLAYDGKHGGFHSPDAMNRFAWIMDQCLLDIVGWVHAKNGDFTLIDDTLMAKILCKFNAAYVHLKDTLL